MSRLRNSKIEPTAPPPATSRRQVAAEQRPDAENPGDIGGEAIPVPIPNTEVKLSSAEDTERAAFRENRSSPGFLRFPRLCCLVATTKAGGRSPVAIGILPRDDDAG